MDVWNTLPFEEKLALLLQGIVPPHWRWYQRWPVWCLLFPLSLCLLICVTLSVGSMRLLRAVGRGLGHRLPAGGTRNQGQDIR